MFYNDDYVSGNLVADAEMLSIINEIVHHFPALSNRNCHIRLNHSLLLRAILSNFNAEDLYSDVYKILIDAKVSKEEKMSGHIKYQFT